MRVSAIVPASDRPATLDRCLAALRAAEDGPDEIVCVREPAGTGPAEARNLGAAAATGDVLVFVDADVVVHPDAFRLIRARLSDPDVAGVFGSYDEMPEERQTVSVFRNLLHHYVHQEGAGPAVTFWSGLGAIRREAFLAVGGFDANRFPTPSIEDVELGTRLTAAGHALELDPRIQGTHLKRWTLRRMVETDLLARGAPWVALALRQRAVPATLNLGWRHRVSAVAAVALVGSLAARRPLPTACATATLLAANSGFYTFLVRKMGLRGALTGVPLHLLHHLTAVAALPVGLAQYCLEAARNSSPERPAQKRRDGA
jgi:GT2 family glycosyltransferase